MPPVRKSGVRISGTNAATVAVLIVHFFCVGEKPSKSAVASALSDITCERGFLCCIALLRCTLAVYDCWPAVPPTNSAIFSIAAAVSSSINRTCSHPSMSAMRAFCSAVRFGDASAILMPASVLSNIAALRACQ